MKAKIERRDGSILSSSKSSLPMWLSSLMPLWHAATCEWLYTTAMAVRLALIGWGALQDRWFDVKYTDVDYRVITDAARLVWEAADSPAQAGDGMANTAGLFTRWDSWLGGGSPFDRSTYRYTPILAYMMIPSIATGLPVLGKLVFVCCDMFVGRLSERVLASASGGRISGRDAKRWAAIWLLNPLSINISTRGNAESVVAAVVLACVAEALDGRVFRCGAWLGLAVHLKIYPVIYAPALVLHVAVSSAGRHRASGGAGGWRDVAAALTSRRSYVLAFAAAAVYASFTAFFYAMYGWPFLYESTLYHVVRSDHRHNLSVFFLSMYYNVTLGGSNSFALAVMGPQLCLMVAIAVRFSRHLTFCLFLQTIVFVMFNKVCTFQYFIWFVSLLCPVVPQLAMSRSDVMKAVVLWSGSLALWLYHAYLFEFEGHGTFLSMWMSGIAIFLSNAWVVTLLISRFRPFSTPACKSC